MTRRALLKALYDKGVFMTEETIRNYTRGYKIAKKGVKHVFSFYPDVLPHSKMIRNHNDYDLAEVLKWLVKHKMRFYFGVRKDTRGNDILDTAQQ